MCTGANIAMNENYHQYFNETPLFHVALVIGLILFY